MKSMTGYGKASFATENIEIEVEIKSVNHRFFELRMYLPNELEALELNFRRLLNNTIKRGKIDFRIKLVDKRLPEIELDTLRLKAFWDIYKKAAQVVESQQEPKLEIIANQNSIINLKTASLEGTEIINKIDEIIAQAIEEHQQMALNEGKHMHDFFVGSLNKIHSSLKIIEIEFPDFKTKVFNKLKNSLDDILKEHFNDDDYRRILAETAIYVEKADVTEEIVRLKNHLDKFQHKMNEECAEKGKSLNFILQEMHREANTIGSKFNTPSVFSSILTIKEEVEKCREMVQNVE